ncbi:MULTISPECIES: hypothetical protein [unclassified Streptomyces]|uniref:hypothetical protein n=1 Tax=unclassified Streptomyces TaxID=2593676 RepID=UPI0033BA0E9C
MSMGRGRARYGEDSELERTRARYGLLAVVLSNCAIVVVTVVGVWRLDGDKSVIVGVLTAAFTAMTSMTTAYLGIKAVSNTAKSFALGDAARREPLPAAPAPAPAQEPAPAAVPAPAAPTS